MDGELKPCPFCRVRHLQLYINKEDPDYACIKCLECGCEGPPIRFKELALELWNDRKTKE